MIAFGRLKIPTTTIAALTRQMYHQWHVFLDLTKLRVHKNNSRKFRATCAFAKSASVVAAAQKSRCMHNVARFCYGLSTAVNEARKALVGLKYPLFAPKVFATLCLQRGAVGKEMNMKINDDFFKAVYDEAVKAAHEAIVAERAVRPEDPMAFDCGFAWATVKPATQPFIRWCRAQVNAAGDIAHERGHNEQRRAIADASMQYGSKAYGGGWQFWEPGNFSGQSIRIHRIGAEAFAVVLKRHNIEGVSTGSRLD